MRDIHSNRLFIQDLESELNSSTVRKQFEEKLSKMPGDESYFLLTTFANMALAREHQDYDFIRATTIDLFQVSNRYIFKPSLRVQFFLWILQIGFLSAKTQDSCSKDARSLLSNLTNKYPTLLSDILIKLKDNFGSVGKVNSIYILVWYELFQCHFIFTVEFVFIYQTQTRQMDSKWTRYHHYFQLVTPKPISIDGESFSSSNPHAIKLGLWHVNFD